MGVLDHAEFSALSDRVYAAVDRTVEVTGARPSPFARELVALFLASLIADPLRTADQVYQADSEALPPGEELFNRALEMLPEVSNQAINRANLLMPDAIITGWQVFQWIASDRGREFAQRMGCPPYPDV